MNNEPLLNFHQSTTDIATAGQPTRGQFVWIAEQGYRWAINLAMHDSDNAIAEEGNIVVSLGMSYLHIPVPFESPTAEHLSRFIDLMGVLKGEIFFVHCAVNARVSAFMYKYLTLNNDVDADKATSPLLKRWLPEMDDQWKFIMQLNANDLNRL